ncbi:MAG: exodeoxyribonuclease VII large subunit [Bacteroidaceae bacterium]|nr:exodeoxyribonuclease VII large subunit [Bacteroidaceae bacterium]
MTQQPLTLFQLNSLVRETLEAGLPDTYWVQGELSEGRAGYGGHFYGELVQKDERRGIIVAKARVTCWANAYSTLAPEFEAQTGETLRAGLNVLLCVSVTFHQQYGFSLTIHDIDPSYTLGDMARRRQQILRQLEADGILHDNQTLPLPLLARRIAVVSSESAAGYGDFCNQLQQNDYGFHFRLRLFPAVMQGSRVEESVIAALERIAAEAEQWDVVVIIRGGGATSDLSDFDSYPLAACIAQMPLPVITGIGHERDETVLDHVAHTHLKTPTAVAAFLIDHLARQLQTIDDLSRRIAHSVADRLQSGRRHIDLLEQRLRSDAAQLLLRHRHRIDLLEQRLRGLDPQLLLRRGYSITLDSEGRLLRDASQVTPGQTITTRLEKGQITSTIVSCKRK